MMSRNLPVDWTRPWFDHAQGWWKGALWTVDGRFYQAVNILIGVVFALVQPFVETLIIHLLAWIGYVSEKKPVTNATSPSSRAWYGPFQPPQTSTANAQGANDRSTSRSCFACCSSDFWARTISIVILFFAAGNAIASSFVTELPTEDVALSRSKTCGAWELQDDANPAAQDADALIQGEREARAGQYARDCYGSQYSRSINRCMIFRKPYIPAAEFRTGQQCPFVNDTFCPGTRFEAVRMSTGLVDAQNIGINVAKGPKYNRTSICTPLDMGAGFVERPVNATYAKEWGYKLGKVDSDENDSNYTFYQQGNPWDYDVRSYTMSTVTHVYSDEEDSYWQPIPSLNIRPELSSKSMPYSLTLMFINSCRIFYKESSDDPIFPAAERSEIDPDLWVNTDSRARPLACIDWIEACSNDGRCSSPFENNQEEDNHHAFVRYALQNSYAFQTIQSRGASGLDAQYKIRDDTSVPLDRDPPQWITESYNLFNASLARIQFDALDIANGTGSDMEPLYTNSIPPTLRGQMCGFFTFQIPKDWHNVVLWPFLLLELGVPFLLFLMAIETSQEYGEKQMQSGWFEDKRMILLEVLMGWILTFIIGLWNVLKAVRDHFKTTPQSDIEGQQESEPLRPADTTSYGAGAIAQPPEVRPQDPSASVLSEHAATTHDTFVVGTDGSDA